MTAMFKSLKVLILAGAILVAAPVSAQYAQWQATSDTIGVHWSGQTEAQAQAALAVDMVTAKAAIQQALGSIPDIMGILAGSSDTSYAWVNNGWDGKVQVLRSVDGGRTWTSIWLQNGSVDDWKFNRAGAVATDPLSGVLWIGGNRGLYRDQVAVDLPPGAQEICALAVDPTDYRLWIATDSIDLPYAGRISGIGLFRRSEVTGSVAWEDMTGGLTRTVVAIGFDPRYPGRVYLRLKHLRGKPDVVSAEVPEVVTPEMVGWISVSHTPAQRPMEYPSGLDALRVRRDYPRNLVLLQGGDYMNAHITGYPFSLGGVVYLETYVFYYGNFSRGLARSRDGGISWEGVGGYGGYEHGQMGAGKVLLWDNRERTCYSGNGLPGIAGKQVGPWTTHPLDAGTVYQSQIGRGHLYRSYDLSSWEELTAGLDPMLEPRSVVVDSLSRVYLVTNHGTFMHQDLVRPYRIASLTVAPDTVRLGEDVPVRLVAEVKSIEGTQVLAQVTALCWGKEYDVPRLPNGRYELSLASPDLAPGFYGVTVTAAPPGEPLARASAMHPVMVAPSQSLPVFGDTVSAEWQVKVLSGTMALASTSIHGGSKAIQMNGEVVFHNAHGQPINPFGYRLEFYASVADTHLIQDLHVNGLGLKELGALRSPADGLGAWYRIDLAAEQLLVSPRYDEVEGRYLPASLDEIQINAAGPQGQVIYLDDIRLVPVGREDAIQPTAVLSDFGTEPHTFRLSPTFPNPFNASTVIPFELARDGQVHMEVYNLLGQRVRQLLSAPLAAGSHILSWDGRTDNDRPLATGIYIVRLESGQEARMVKAMLLR
jgi:hypothetical protein